MILPQELRIGNLVTINNYRAWPDLKDIPLTVIELSTEMDEYEKELFPKSKGTITLQGKSETYNQFSQFIEPIELNEDWLLKLGFDSNNVSYKIDNDRFIFELYFYDAWNLNYVEKEKFGNGSVELSGYWKIHELQNLFFDFTGEELEIKES